MILNKREFKKLNKKKKRFYNKKELEEIKNSEYINYSKIYSKK